MNHSFGDAQGRMLPVDRLLIGYFAFCSLMIFLFWRLPQHRAIYLAFHLSVIVGIFALTHVPASVHRLLVLAREWYPYLLVLPLYLEIEVLNRLWSLNFYDAYIIEAEGWLFNGQPALYLSEMYPYPLLSEYLHFSHFAYLLMPPCLLLPLFLLKRVEGFRNSLFFILSTYVACFLVFLFFPLESPNFIWEDITTGPLVDYPFFRLVHEGMDKGVIKGAAFPSSHVAVATACAYCAYRYLRPLFPLYAVLAPSIACGIVYGRLHYALDGVVGLAFGLAAPYLAERLLRRHARRSKASTPVAAPALDDDSLPGEPSLA